jgi:hypothetical protein
MHQLILGLSEALAAALNAGAAEIKVLSTTAVKEAFIEIPADERNRSRDRHQHSGISSIGNPELDNLVNWSPKGGGANRTR